MRAGGVDLDGDGVPDEDDEPPMRTRAEAKVWRKWAHEKAKDYADTVHPRLQHWDCATLSGNSQQHHPYGQKCRAAGPSSWCHDLPAGEPQRCHLHG